MSIIASGLPDKLYTIAQLEAADGYQITLGQKKTEYSLSVVLAKDEIVSTLSAVTGTTSSTVLLHANTNRKSFILYNDGKANLFLAFAGTASISLFTYFLSPMATLEVSPCLYSGIISGIWDKTGAIARLTELTT